MLLPVPSWTRHDSRGFFRAAWVSFAARAQVCTFFQIQHPARSDVVGTFTQVNDGVG